LAVELAKLGIPVHHVSGRCHRIVDSCYPPIHLFEDVADASQFDALCALEGLTSERMREQAGEISLVAEADRIYGEGTGSIMAAFTYLNEEGSRFSDGSYGVYYAGLDTKTAIRETIYHKQKFMGYTHEPAQEIDMREYIATADARLHDIRGISEAMPDVYDPDSYVASRAFAVPLRLAGAWGISYDSVRNPIGQCLAIFRPPALSRCMQAKHFAYVWDGNAITHTYEKTHLKKISS